MPLNKAEATKTITVTGVAPPSLFSIVSLALPIAACTIIIWLGIRQL